jgi:hypothetical protein
MPFPLPGDGDLTITSVAPTPGYGQGQVLPTGAIYLAAYSATVSAPVGDCP